MILGVAHNCGRNLRLALLQLQALKYNKSSEISFLPYQKQIRDIVVMLVKEQSPAQIKRIRDMCYDLLVNCVEGFTILKEMVLGLIAEFTAKQGQKGSNQLKEETLKELISIGAQHERSMMCGSKVIYHLESFVAHAM